MDLVVQMPPVRFEKTFLSNKHRQVWFWIQISTFLCFLSETEIKNHILSDIYCTYQRTFHWCLFVKISQTKSYEWFFYKYVLVICIFVLFLTTEPIILNWICLTFTGYDDDTDNWRKTAFPLEAEKLHDKLERSKLSS